MKRFLVLILIFTTFSCSKKEVSSKGLNHLTYLNLKGNVKEIDIVNYEHEITENNYVPKGKITDNVFDKYSSHIDLIFNLKESEFMTTGKVFDPYSLSIKEISDFNFCSKCTDYNLKFNQAGFITNFVGTENGIKRFEKKFQYDNENRIINSSSENKCSDSYGKTFYTNVFEYNDYNLLSKLITKIEKDDKLIKELEYNIQYEWQKDGNSIKAVEREMLNNSDATPNNYSLELNSDNEIIRFQNKLQTQSYENYKIKSFTVLNEQGEIESNREYQYNGEKLTKANTTLRYNFKSENEKGPKFNYNEYIFDYNSNNDILAISLNPKEDNTFFSDVSFTYNYDTRNNWDNLTYVLDRKHYDNAVKKVLIYEQKGNYLTGMDKISHLLDNEGVRLKTNRNLLKTMSSKIVVKRSISYY